MGSDDNSGITTPLKDLTWVGLKCVPIEQETKKTNRLKIIEALLAINISIISSLFFLNHQKTCAIYQKYAEKGIF